MKKILFFGSIFAVAIIVLSSFPSVVGVQIAKTNDEKFDVFIDKFISRIQKNDRFKDINVNEITGILQHIQYCNVDDYWFPGFYIMLLFIYIVFLPVFIWLLLIDLSWKFN